MYRAIVLLVASIASLALAQSKPSAMVTLNQLVEQRELSVRKGAFTGYKNRIELSLHIDGPDVEEAHKYGKLKASKAVDDAGTDLTKAPENYASDSEPFREIRDDERTPTGFDVDLTLPTPSARSATAIPLIAGELTVLVGGEKKIVAVKPIKSSEGKAIDDPVLKAVGATVTLIEPTEANARRKLGGLKLKTGPERCVMVEIDGNIDAISSVNVVDASGQKMDSWKSSSHDRSGPRVVLFEVVKAVPASASLQLEVWPGQKTVVVPFELKDIKLP